MIGSREGGLFLFNAIIDGFDLREIEMSGRKFTWANDLQVPTYEKLDRVLVSVEWEQKFPLATVDALSREIERIKMSTRGG
jgi:hypothetical protein